MKQDHNQREQLMAMAIVILIFILASMGTLYIMQCEKYNGQLPIVNNTLANLGALKKDCEKDLPRSKECIMVYDFVAVDKD
jgi:hypothetical protein